MTQRRAGMIEVKVGGVQQECEGSFSIGLGSTKRTANEGSGGIHGYAEKPQVAFIEGAIFLKAGLDMPALLAMDGETVTCKLGTDDTVALADAWQAGEGKIDTEKGTLEVRFESSKPAQVIS